MPAERGQASVELLGALPLVLLLGAVLLHLLAVGYSASLAGAAAEAGALAVAGGGDAREAARARAREDRPASGRTRGGTVVTAWPELRRGRVFGAVAARAEAWLLEPGP